MKSVLNPVTHLLAVLVLVIVTAQAAVVLPQLSDASDALMHLYFIYLPVALFIQSALIHLFAGGSMSDRRRLNMDTLSVIATCCIIVILPLVGGRTHLMPSIGVSVVLLLLMRSVFLVRILLRMCSVKKRSIVSLYTGLLIFALMLPLAGWRLAARPLDGDEPYYLLQSYSLLHDGDLDLTNNYIDGDSLSFVHRRLQPQQFDDAEDGRLLSRHPPLMSLLLIPGFFLAGTHGAVISGILLTAMLAGLICYVVTGFHLPCRYGVLTAFLISLTAPIVLYSTALFTETAGAVLGVSAIAIAMQLADRRRIPVTATLLVLIIAFALKPRFAILTIPPIFAGLVSRYGMSRRLLRYVFVVLLVFAAGGIANVFLYGNPLVRYSLQDLPGMSPVRLFRGIVGLIWDPQYGILPLNPVLLLAAPGFAFMLRKTRRSRCGIWLASVLPYFLAVAAMAELSGGICPRGRFMVAWIPLLSIPLAFSLQALDKYPKRVYIFLAALPSVILAGILLIRPDWQIVFPGSTDHLLSALSLSLNRDVLSLLPSFDRVDTHLFVVGTVLTILLLIIAALPFRNPHRKSGRGTPELPLCILGLMCLSLALITGCCHWQTPWMHLEDVSFRTRGNVQLFWEETRAWDYHTPSPSPYRVGRRIYPGGTVIRSMPLRHPAAGAESPFLLEIDARGSPPDEIIPGFFIHFDDGPGVPVRLRSTAFETYRVNCPDHFNPAATQITLSVPARSNDSTWVDVDRLRISHREPAPARIQAHPKRFLPISFTGITVEDVIVPAEAVRQGEPFEIRLTYTISQMPALNFALLLKTGTRTSYHPLTLETREGHHTTTQEISADITAGTGSFDLLLLAHDPLNQTDFELPQGLNTYRVGYGAWLGKIRIDPSPIAIQETDLLEAAARATGTDIHRMKLVPYAFHLSAWNQLAVDLEDSSTVGKIIFISRLSHVFEEIPFRTQIGEVHLNIEGNIETKPFIIGQDTAEAMYEFGGKEVRLSHRKPPVALRRPSRVEWPFVLKGIEYESLYYWTEYDLIHPGPVEHLTVRSLSFPGVWNLEAIICVSDS